MKNLNNGPFFFLGILFLSLSILQGCDKVDAPFIEKKTVDTTSNPTPQPSIFTDTTPQPKIILLEDYTGHRCGNCPPAAVVAGNLKTQHGEQLVVMAVHAGILSMPVGSMPYDFRNPVSNEWYTFFGAPSNPNGMINRIGKPTNTQIKPFTTWAGEVASLVSLAADANIFIVNEYSATDKKLTVNLKAKWLTALTGNYKLGVYIIEDSIVKPQLDYNLTPDTVYNYVHRHALRGAVNSTWGDDLATPVVGASEIKSYTMTLNTTWVPEHCEVVAFIYNASTYEIVQAIEKKVVN